jgi:hypothetical protein
VYLLPLSALVYVLSLGIFRTFSQEEITHVKLFFQKNGAKGKFLKNYGTKK